MELIKPTFLLFWLLVLQISKLPKYKFVAQYRNSLQQTSILPDQTRAKYKLYCFALKRIRYYLLLQNNLPFKARRLHSYYNFVTSEVSRCLRNIITCLCCLAVLHVWLCSMSALNFLFLGPVTHQLPPSDCSTFYILH